MYVSVTEPIRKAITRTWWVLVTTGYAEKRIQLGFCAFLAAAIENTSYDHALRSLGIATTPLGPNEPMVVTLALLLLGMWLSSRGELMLLDGIIRNRGAVRAPWRECKAEGNRLFVARLVLTLTWLAPGGLVFYAVMQGGATGNAPFGWPVLAGLGLLGGAAALVLLGIHLLLLELVVPTMYLRRLPVLAAWRVAREELLPGHGWTILLFFLIQTLLRLATILLLLALVALQAPNAAGVQVVMLLLGTAIVLLIYVLYVFRKSYTLFFIEQFGPRWHVFVHDPVGPYCRSCGYDLSGTPANQCSECGTEIPAVQWEWLQQQRNAPNQ